jgi:hypothetical protein
MCVGRHHCWAAGPLGLGLSLSIYCTHLLSIHQAIFIILHGIRGLGLGFLLPPPQPPPPCPPPQPPASAPPPRETHPSLTGRPFHPVAASPTSLPHPAPELPQSSTLLCSAAQLGPPSPAPPRARARTSQPPPPLRPHPARPRSAPAPPLPVGARRRDPTPLHRRCRHGRSHGIRRLSTTGSARSLHAARHQPASPAWPTPEAGPPVDAAATARGRTPNHRRPRSPTVVPPWFRRPLPSPPRRRGSRGGCFCRAGRERRRAHGRQRALPCRRRGLPLPLWRRRHLPLHVQRRRRRRRCDQHARGWSHRAHNGHRRCGQCARGWAPTTVPPASNLSSSRLQQLSVRANPSLSGALPPPLASMQSL